MAFNEKMIRCPYDPMHVMREDRLQYHLVKCRKQHPDKNFEICPYNVTHQLPQEQIEDHIKNCSNSKHFRQNTISPENHVYLANPPILGSSAIPDENDHNESNHDNSNESKMKEKPLDSPGRSSALKTYLKQKTKPPKKVDPLIAELFTPHEIDEFSLGFEQHPDKTGVFYSKGRGCLLSNSNNENEELKPLRRPKQLIPPGRKQ